MSTQQFPALIGLAWPVKRTQMWKTRKQGAISGKETAIADWQTPRWRWEVNFELLRQGAGLTEFATLAGFFGQMLGGFDSFLYTDADDNAVTGQSLGSGIGTLAAFPLLRSFGGTTQPVLAPNAMSAVYLAGVSIPAAGIAAPGAPSLSQLGESGLGASGPLLRPPLTAGGFRSPRRKACQIRSGGSSARPSNTWMFSAE